MTLQLETERLILRETQEKDADAFIQYTTDPRFFEHILIIPTLEGTRDFVRRNIERNNMAPRSYWYMTLILKETNTVIGDISLRADPKRYFRVGGIGYGLNPDYWNKGLMTEALRAMTSFAHDKLHQHRIEARADDENPGSWRVMEKSGFIRESTEAYAVYGGKRWREKTHLYVSIRPDIVNNKVKNDET